MKNAYIYALQFVFKKFKRKAMILFKVNIAKNNLYFIDISRS